MPTNTSKKHPEAQNPLILRSHRLMEAFAKSDDERDFYLDKIEGFILFVNLDKSEEELKALEKELKDDPDRYCAIPKFSFFETKKIMEGFVNEKVYDIDTKEKLLDIIQSKEAREHFLEFIYDHHAELEKWQQYYQERSRIRIIEWLRNHHFNFVFEEDLDLAISTIERLKENIFEKKVQKDIEVARKSLGSKAKTYYSTEALNPRPKRGRPPKQAQKIELEPQVTTDIYTTVPPAARPFLFTPEISSVFDVTFSSRFETGQELLAHRKQTPEVEEFEESLQAISQKLATLRQLSSKWMQKGHKEPAVTGLEEEKKKEKNLLQTPEDQERFLIQKLEERKKSAAAKSAVHPKAGRKKEVKTIEVTEKKLPPAAKKILPKKEDKAKKPQKAAKRPVRKILPVKKSKSASGESQQKSTQQKRALRKTAPKTQSKKNPKKS